MNERHHLIVDRIILAVMAEPRMSELRNETRKEKGSLRLARRAMSCGRYWQPLTVASCHLAWSADTRELCPTPYQSIKHTMQAAPGTELIRHRIIQFLVLAGPMLNAATDTLGLKLRRTGSACNRRLANAQARLASSWMKLQFIQRERERERQNAQQVRLNSACANQVLHGELRHLPC